jgi:hypothetical protein
MLAARFARCSDTAASLFAHRATGPIVEILIIVNGGACDPSSLQPTTALIPINAAVLRLLTGTAQTLAAP